MFHSRESYVLNTKTSYSECFTERKFLFKRLRPHSTLTFFSFFTDIRVILRLDGVFGKHEYYYHNHDKGRIYQSVYSLGIEQLSWQSEKRNPEPSGGDRVKSPPQGDWGNHGLFTLSGESPVNYESALRGLEFNIVRQMRFADQVADVFLCAD